LFARYYPDFEIAEFPAVSRHQLETHAEHFGALGIARAARQLTSTTLPLTTVAIPFSACVERKPDERSRSTTPTSTFSSGRLANGSRMRPAAFQIWSTAVARPFDLL